MPRTLHTDACPDCGAVTTFHGLDAPGHCPHLYETRVPAEFVSLDDLNAKLVEMELHDDLPDSFDMGYVDAHRVSDPLQPRREVLRTEIVLEACGFEWYVETREAE